MYLSLDLIMKSEEPMVFSKLQGSSKNNNAQLRTGTRRKIGIIEYYIPHSALTNPIVCVAAKFSDLSFSSTSHWDLKRKKYLNQ